MTEHPFISVLILRTISQPETRYVRNLDVELTRTADITQNVGPEDNDPLTFHSQLTVAVQGVDSESPAFEFYSDVLVRLAVPDDQELPSGDDEEYDRAAAAHVRRLADPYHRQSLSDSMSKAGVPVFTLPFPQALGWQTTRGK